MQHKGLLKLEPPIHNVDEHNSVAACLSVDMPHTELSWATLIAALDVRFRTGGAEKQVRLLGIMYSQRLLQSFALQPCHHAPTMVAPPHPHLTGSGHKRTTVRRCAKDLG